MDWFIPQILQYKCCTTAKMTTTSLHQCWAIRWLAFYVGCRRLQRQKDAKTTVLWLQTGQKQAKGWLQINIWDCTCKLAWVQYDENSWQLVDPHSCGSGCYSHTSKSNAKMPGNQSGTKNLPAAGAAPFLYQQPSRAEIRLVGFQMKLSRTWFTSRSTCASLGFDWGGYEKAARTCICAHWSQCMFDARLWSGWRDLFVFSSLLCFFFPSFPQGQIEELLGEQHNI